jgi:predicted esterase
MALKEDPEVFNAAYELYLQGEVQQGYDLLTAAAPNHPENAQRIYEWRFDMAAKLGKLELAEEILERALDAGCFYGEFALRKDDDLQVMQGRPRFESLVERSYLMLYRVQQSARPLLKVINEGGASRGKTPLLMALHGNSSSTDRFEGYWDSLKGTDWLVALPQSSQVNGKDIYVWNDLEIAERELIDHYLALTREHVIDPTRTIAAGFSKGGHAVIQAAFKQIFPIAGFIAIAPYIPDVEGMMRLLEPGKRQGLRGYFLLGGEDKQCTPGATRLYEELVKRGIPCGIEVFPGLAHEFPQDFNAALQRAIQLVTGKENA